MLVEGFLNGFLADFCLFYIFCRGRQAHLSYGLSRRNQFEGSAQIVRDGQQIKVHLVLRPTPIAGTAKPQHPLPMTKGSLNGLADRTIKLVQPSLPGCQRLLFRRLVQETILRPRLNQTLAIGRRAIGLSLIHTRRCRRIERVSS